MAYRLVPMVFPIGVYIRQKIPLSQLLQSYIYIFSFNSIDCISVTNGMWFIYFLVKIDQNI